MNSNTDEFKTLHLFKALSQEQLSDLLDTSQDIRLERGELLFNKGDVSEHFYYVRSGQIKILRSSSQGLEKILSIAQPGQLFAEAVMFLDKNEFPAAASALQASEVIAFKNRVFTDYLRSSTDLCMTMLGNLSAKLHAQIVEVDNLSLQNASFRILNFINSLIGADTSSSVDVKLPAPKHTIASRLSITPETLSRSLYELSEKNIIRSTGKGRVIHIPDLAAFKNYLITHE